MEQSGTCFIFGGGDIADDGVVRREAATAAMIICADSGYDHCLRLGLTPHLLMGDFDSIRATAPDTIPRITLSPDKDYTDTSFAVEEALSRGFRTITLTGMTGGRLDHTLANLQTLAYLSRKGVTARITDGVAEVFAFTAPTQGQDFSLIRREGHYFSLLAASEACTNIFIFGGKYPLEGYQLRFDEPRAVCNEFLDTNVIIHMDSGTLLVTTTPIG